MESEVFTLPEVKEEFKNFVIVTLYTDHDANFKIQERLINVSTLPSYVILKPGSEDVVNIIGFPPNPGTRKDEFLKFLKDGHSKALGQ